MAHPGELNRRLALFARRRSQLLLARGIAAGVGVLLLAIVLIACVDRLLVLGESVRLLLSAGAYAAGVGAFLWAGGAAWVGGWLRPLDEAVLASMAESAEPSLRDRLRGAAELRSELSGSDAFRRRAAAAADADAGRLQVRRALPTRLAAWRVAGAALLAAGLLGVAVLPAFREYQVNRLIGRAFLPTADIPRVSRHTVRFVGDAPAPLVARGSTLPVRVQVETRYGPPVSTVEARARLADGTTRRSILAEAEPGVFTGELAIDADARVVVWADDANTKTLDVSVADRPSLVAIQTIVTPPPYLPAVAIEGAGDITALQGGTARIRVQASEPLASATLHFTPADAGETRVLSMSQTDRNWAAEMSVDVAGDYFVRLVSRGTGLTSADEVQWRVSPLNDEPPSLSLRVQEPSDSATFAVPVQASFGAADDYGLKSATTQYRINGGSWVPLTEELLDGRSSGDIAASLDLDAREVGQGDLVEVRAEAIDLAGSVAASQSAEWVVTGFTEDASLVARAALLRDLRPLTLTLADVGAPSDERARAAAEIQSMIFERLPALRPNLPTHDLILLAVAAAGSAEHDWEWADAVDAFAGRLLQDAVLARAAVNVAFAREEAEQVATELSGRTQEAEIEERAMRVVNATAERARRIGTELDEVAGSLALSDRVRRRLEAIAAATISLADEAQREMKMDAAARLAELDRRLRPIPMHLMNSRLDLVADVTRDRAVLSQVASTTQFVSDDPDAAGRLLRTRASLLARLPGNDGRAFVEAADTILAAAATERVATASGDTTELDRIVAASDTLAGGHLVYHLSRHAASETALEEAGDPTVAWLGLPVELRQLEAELESVRTTLLTTGHAARSAQLLRRVGRGGSLRQALAESRGRRGPTRDGNRLRVGRVIRAIEDVAEAIEPEMEAARDILRSIVGELEGRLDDLSAELQNDPDLAQSIRQRALAAMEDEQRMQDLTEASARERSELLEQLRDSVRSAAAEGLTDALREAAERLRQQSAGEAVEGASDPLEALERLANAEDPEAAADALREAAERDQKVSDALNEFARQEAEGAAEQLRRAGELERDVADELAGAVAAAEDADDATIDPEALAEVGRQANRLGRRSDALSTDAAERLREAAASAEAGDADASAAQLKEAAQALREAAEKAEAGAEQAGREANQKAQAASEAFEAGEDAITPYREMEAARERERELDREAGLARRTARDAEALAEEAAAKESAMARAEEREDEARAAAEDAHEAAQEAAEAAAEALERAAEAQRSRGDDAAADQAKAAAEAARAAADNEVAQAQQASEGGSAQQASEAASQASQALSEASQSAGAAAAGSPPSPGASSSGEGGLAEALGQLQPGEAGAVQAAQQAAGSAIASSAADMRRSNTPPPPGAAPGSAAGQASADAGEPAADAMESGSGSGSAASDGGGPLGELPQPGGRWGDLPPQVIRDVGAGQRDRAPAAYRDAVAAYYRAVAERAEQARQRREAQP